MGFYERVKALAKSNKITIEYAVGKAGLTLGAYNNYRRYKNLPRADEAQKIAQALGTTVEYLVTGKTPESTAADEALDKIKAVIDQYRNIFKVSKKA